MSSILLGRGLFRGVLIPDFLLRDTESVPLPFLSPSRLICIDPGVADAVSDAISDMNSTVQWAVQPRC